MRAMMAWEIREVCICEATWIHWSHPAATQKSRTVKIPRENVQIHLRKTTKRTLSCPPYTQASSRQPKAMTGVTLKQTMQIQEAKDRRSHNAKIAAANANAVLFGRKSMDDMQITSSFVKKNLAKHANIACRTDLRSAPRPCKLRHLGNLEPRTLIPRHHHAYSQHHLLAMRPYTPAGLPSSEPKRHSMRRNPRAPR